MRHAAVEKGEKEVKLSRPTKPSTAIGRAIQFALHLLIVYAMVNIVTLWLAGFTQGTLLPLMHHPPRGSSLQFAFSHLFQFTFWPAAVVAFASAYWHRHRPACFVWIVPLAILGYKFLVFPAATSVLGGPGGQIALAVEHYISGNVILPEFHSYPEILSLAASNPEVARALDRFRYAAPLYAALGYSLSTTIVMGLRRHSGDLS